MNDFDHHALANQWTGVVRQMRANEPADRLYFMLFDGCDLAVERHDVDDSGAAENPQALVSMETGETVPGKRGQSTFFFRSFHRINRVVVGRNASYPRFSTCSRTTCS